MRAFGRIVTAALIAILGVLGFAGLAAGVCEGEPLPFAKAVASAKQIVIGDVVAVRPRDDAAPGPSNRFTLQVTHFVRGESLARIEINNVPTQPCANPIVAAVGDRIALALGGTMFDPPEPVNAVVWIVGQPPKGFEATTIENVYKLAGVPMPVPAPAAPKPDPPSPWLGPVMWGLGVGLVFVIGAVVARRVAGR
jgi:starvation-inducible outer membrane lipoprotein